MMASQTINKLDFENAFFSVTIHAAFLCCAIALPQSEEHSQVSHNVMRGANPTQSSTGQQVRLHPGVISSVVIVALAAIVAAIFIIRKYCFPKSDAIYRYSVLRQMEEQNAQRVREEEESDEDLLE